MSNTQYVKELLDKEEEICTHTSGINDLRKIIAFLKKKDNTIFSANCDCGLVKRKHKSYIKDWAI
tara:strand:+ start:4295 stop:4489 length:195 start_codon:yes stop_codon:yes gene_type:complete